MSVIFVIIAFYLGILLMGKYARKVTPLGYLFVGILTAFEVVVVLYLLFTMEVPQP